jgi:hypothetical protein
VSCLVAICLRSIASAAPPDAAYPVLQTRTRHLSDPSVRLRATREQSCLSSVERCIRPARILNHWSKLYTVQNLVIEKRVTGQQRPQEFAQPETESICCRCWVHVFVLLLSIGKPVLLRTAQLRHSCICACAIIENVLVFLTLGKIVFIMGFHVLQRTCPKARMPNLNEKQENDRSKTPNNSTVNN